MTRNIRTYMELFSTGGDVPMIDVRVTGPSEYVASADVVHIGEHNHTLELHLDREHTIALHAKLGKFLAEQQQAALPSSEEPSAVPKD
jgi:hypothetical protein